jgi:hypothetical protein
MVVASFSDEEGGGKDKTHSGTAIGKMQKISGSRK